LPLIVVCFVDESLALIDLKQQDRRLARNAVGVGRFDVAQVAAGLGGKGVVAADRDSLVSALNEALGAATFTLIACPIAAASYQGRV
jgi:acetolactate synthase-1/2/3 large subunit